MANNLFLNSVGPITIRTALDLRRKDEQKPISVIVTFRRRRLYCKTGERVTREQYSSLMRARTTSASQAAKAKARIEKMHLRVYDIVENLVRNDDFCLKAVDEIVNMIPTDKDATFAEHFRRIAEEKKTLKTRISYKTSLISYLKSLKSGKIIDCGKIRIMPRDITASSIAEWQKQLRREGRSEATIAIYTRPVKHVLRVLHKEGVIRAVPEMKIPSGGRRSENFLSVEQILKLMEYRGNYEFARDMWLMLYFCNGCNAKDFISLKWEEGYFQNNELSFIRSKTRDRSPSLVLIPVTKPLKTLLDRHASIPKKGRFLFPELVGGAETDEELTVRADHLNSRIRQGMMRVCKKTGVPRVTAAWARNSYITALTWHGISDAFIDNMTGHVGSNTVLRGYQGRISPAKRLKINSLLTVPPEE